MEEEKLSPNHQKYLLKYLVEHKSTNIHILQQDFTWT